MARHHKKSTIFQKRCLRKENNIKTRNKWLKADILSKRSIQRPLPTDVVMKRLLLRRLRRTKYDIEDKRRDRRHKNEENRRNLSIANSLAGMLFKKFTAYVEQREKSERPGVLWCV